MWAVLGALTCTASALLVGGLGLAAACFVTPRRRALGVAAIGFVTTVVVIVIGADKGTALGPTYGYLAAGHPVANDFSGGLAILSGIVHHPGEVTSELWSRRDLLNPIFQAGGIIGILSGWGLGVALFDVVPNGLNSGPSFISIQSGGFQNFPATVVLVVGSALVVVALLSRARPLWGVIPSVVVRLAGVALGVGALVSSLTLAAQVDPGVAGFWLEVYPPGASTLGQLNATIPVDDEVVVSQGVVGRFADRPYVYAYDSSPETIRLVTRRVWFVITPAMGQETVTAPSAESAIARLVSVDHGTQVLAENGTWVIVVDRARVPRATLQLP